MHSDLRGVSPHWDPSVLPALQVIQGARVAHSVHTHSRAGRGHRQGTGLHSWGACTTPVSRADWFQDLARLRQSRGRHCCMQVDDQEVMAASSSGQLALHHVPLMTMTGSKHSSQGCSSPLGCGSEGCCPSCVITIAQLQLKQCGT